MLQVEIFRTGDTPANDGKFEPECARAPVPGAGAQLIRHSSAQARACHRIRALWSAVERTRKVIFCPLNGRFDARPTTLDKPKPFG
jgi:hypothetical protein